MNFFRKHWFDIGLIFSIVITVYLVLTWNKNDILHNILCLSFISLFIHQFEEYRFPGGFPIMMNKAFYKSKTPEKYPLNSNTVFIINVVLGWSSYILSIIFLKYAVWIAIATVSISVGNFIAHSVLFNLKGKTIYNPGMISSVILYLPISLIFYIMIIINNRASLLDWVFGIILSVILTYLGLFKTIDIMKNKNSKYVFKIK